MDQGIKSSFGEDKIKTHSMSGFLLLSNIIILIS